MAYMNKVMLIGRLGKDPEMSKTASGNDCVRFTLATSHKVRNRNGEVSEQTEWHHIIGWGSIANLFNKIDIKKGSLVYIEGSLNYYSWTDQGSGEKRYGAQVVMNSINVIDFNNGHKGNSSRGAMSDNQNNDVEDAYNGSFSASDDGLPF